MNISANAVHPGVITTNLFRDRTIVSGIFSNLTFDFTCYLKRKGLLIHPIMSNSFWLLPWKNLYGALFLLAFISVPSAFAVLLNSIGKIICRSVEQVYSPLVEHLHGVYINISVVEYALNLTNFVLYLLKGDATTCYVAMHPQIKGLSGKYFANCNIGSPSSQASDPELAKKLWQFSLQTVSSWSSAYLNKWCADCCT